MFDDIVYYIKCILFIMLFFVLGFVTIREKDVYKVLKVLSYWTFILLFALIILFFSFKIVLCIFDLSQFDPDYIYKNPKDIYINNNEFGEVCEVKRKTGFQLIQEDILFEYTLEMVKQNKPCIAGMHMKLYEINGVKVQKSPNFIVLNEVYKIDNSAGRMLEFVYGNDSNVSKENLKYAKKLVNGYDLHMTKDFYFILNPRIIGWSKDERSVTEKSSENEWDSLKKNRNIWVRVIGDFIVMEKNKITIREMKLMFQEELSYCLQRYMEDLEKINTNCIY